MIIIYRVALIVTILAKHVLDLIRMNVLLAHWVLTELLFRMVLINAFVRMDFMILIILFVLHVTIHVLPALDQMIINVCLVLV